MNHTSRPTATGAAPTRSRAIELAIADYTVRQHGAVSREQLLHCGLSHDAVNRRIASARLRRRHRNVFIVGHVETALTPMAAALLAAGSGSALSHRSAAALLQWPAPAPAGVEVTSPRDLRRIAGLLGHIRRLQPDERTEIQGLAVTSMPMTVLDLAEVLTQRELERAVAHALRVGVDAQAIRDLMTRYPRRRGRRRLAALLGGPHGTPFTRSQAEEKLLGLLRRAGIELPRVNRVVCGYELDCFWPRQRLAVEVDGYTYHSSSGMFEQDRRRDAVLAAAGIRVARVTWRQLQREPEAVAVRIALSLARGDGAHRE